MIQPPDFRFTLICLGKEWVLPQAPKGWEESQLNWARSFDYHGVVRTYTTPYQFVLDGAWLLRRVYFTEGIEGKCRLKIEILDRANWLDRPNQYKLLYIGDIDFSMFKDDGDTVEVNVLESGVSAAIKAYENVKYELDLEGAIDVRLPGIDRIEDSSSSIYLENANTSGYYPGIIINENELYTERVKIQEQPFKTGAVAPDPNGWFILGEDAETETRIFGTLEYQVMKVANYNYRVQLIDETESLVATVFDTAGQPNSGTYNFDLTINIPAGKKIYIRVYRYGSGSTIVIPFFQLLPTTTINVSYGITTEPTIVKALRPFDLFGKLINKMGSDGPIASNILSEWSNLVITCGDAIRGIEEAKIKTSFRDFFKSLNAVINVGFGIDEGVARIEGRRYWFRDLQILDLGEVNKVIVEPAEEYIFNSIKAGYPDHDYEVDYGREEYNSEQIWSTAITRIQKQIDLSSVYRADQYGIEQVRIAQLDQALDNRKEKDKPQDNDVFFIHIKKSPGEDGVYDVLGADNYTNISGISARSSSYNMGITPKKNVLRHGYILRSILPDSSVIDFASATKNAEFSTTDLNGVTIKENVPIPVSSLEEPLFYPIAVTVTTKLPSSVQDIIEERSFGYMKFLYREQEFYGYILEASQDVGRNSEREFKLLLTRHSDPTRLIY